MSNPEPEKSAFLNRIGLRPSCIWEQADAALFADFLPADMADELQREILQQVDWQQHRVFLFGQWRDCPRLSAWHGDAGARYAYTGQALEPRPWIAPLTAIRIRLQQALGLDFNSVLLNRYRDGDDAMGWHSDNEPSLGPEPVIASISLGATRKFSLRTRSKPRQYHHLDLSHASLLLMAGRCQHDWQHQLPRTRRAVGQRINLTFRRIRG